MRQTKKFVSDQLFLHSAQAMSYAAGEHTLHYCAGHCSYDTRPVTNNVYVSLFGNNSMITATKNTLVNFIICPNLINQIGDYIHIGMISICSQDYPPAM